MGSQGEATKEPMTGSLARQGSLYNLTLDEVQNQLGNLGKPLGSLNLDELLKSVSTAEAGQAPGLDSHSNGNANVQPGEPASGLFLNRQESLTLSGDLSKKTVDEVWRDILQKSSDQDRTAQERQPTMGEMTLEDFLVKAGVGTESLPIRTGAMSGVNSPSTHWLQCQLPPLQPPPRQHQNQPNMIADFMAGHAVQQSFSVSLNPVLDVAFPESMVTSSFVGTLSDAHIPGRKRLASGDVVEKTVDRRQKRMIKNRESAARSRARKQAYTNELENKVRKLEDENERLRRQNLHQIVRAMPRAPVPEPRCHLRRTSSAPF